MDIVRDDTPLSRLQDRLNAAARTVAQKEAKIARLEARMALLEQQQQQTAAAAAAAPAHASSDVRMLARAHTPHARAPAQIRKAPQDDTHAPPARRLASVSPAAVRQHSVASSSASRMLVFGGVGLLQDAKWWAVRDALIGLMLQPPAPHVVARGGTAILGGGAAGEALLVPDSVYSDVHYSPFNDQRETAWTAIFPSADAANLVLQRWRSLAHIEHNGAASAAGHQRPLQSGLWMRAYTPAAPRRGGGNARFGSTAHAAQSSTAAASAHAVDQLAYFDPRTLSSQQQSLASTPHHDTGGAAAADDDGAWPFLTLPTGDAPYTRRFL